ncbi:MAG: UDP-N-acetylmuramoyl-L-alanine--D-glutamate ligase [Clostridia bacterium]|nr:UDP-N-acetylmuramoyl-L-alanine--D-glutamate ligase [Clostridia bacterium]
MTRQKYTFDDFKKKIRGKKVGIAGLGISNRPLIDLLYEAGAILTLRDKKEPEQELTEKIKKYGLKHYFGDGYLENIEEEILIKSPGMRPDLPQFDNVPVVTNEMQLFFDVCPARIIAVTGSDGKTTTTTLVSEFLKDAGYKVWLGGNIGNPLFCQSGNISENDIVVLELSSFQLMSLTSSPEFCVITNISPNHLDWHRDFDEYVEAKKNIYRFTQDSTVVVNNDNDITRKIGDEIEQNRVRRFSRLSDVRDGVIYLNGEKIIDKSDIFIPGEHNVENFQAAIAVTADFVSSENVKKVANTFGGVAHRCEFVREKDGVKYFNSSIDSSPSRTLAAVKIFEEKIIAICGGYDKNLDYDPLGEVFAQRLKALILTGATSEKIFRSVNKVPHDYPIFFEDNLADAVQRAKKEATAGDVVVLTPASASFDAFKNFEHRGNYFKEQVNLL